MIVLDQDDGVLGRELNDVKQTLNDGTMWYQNGMMERWGTKMERWNDGAPNGTIE